MLPCLSALLLFFPPVAGGCVKCTGQSERAETSARLGREFAVQEEKR